MVKLVVIYTEPTDVRAFENHFSEVHTPLVKKMPGIRRLEKTRFTGGPLEPARYYLMAAVYFDTRDEMMAALSSPEGMAVAKDLMSFAAGKAHVMFGEVEQIG
ncbi:MAG: EthD family reductase [Phycisphaerales bacterium]|nr:MAG: EthD family reductase [Phycisphaerales bacterium]